MKISFGGGRYTGYHTQISCRATAMCLDHDHHPSSPPAAEALPAAEMKPSSLELLGAQWSTPSRRSFLLMGLGTFLAGCADNKTATVLPGPVWKPREMPAPVAPPPAPTPSGFAYVINRDKWAKGAPGPSDLNKMLPISSITVHHDGMEPFYSTDQNSAAWRLEKIRTAHRANGWADIGYHFAIDRDGRVWQGRPLQWQGAHVKNRNEGNIGVLMMGNFDRQSPSTPQTKALAMHINKLMNLYKVPTKRVYTHQEWPGAATACPGVNLQRYMVSARSNGVIG